MPHDDTGAYFDNNATTPVDPRVRDAMLPWLGGVHGNPSSAHRGGREAKRAVEEARGHVAELFGGEPEEIVFTSSGSEANNMVVYDAAQRCGFYGHLITSTLEHPSVRAAAAAVKRAGMEVTELRPAADGTISAERVEGVLTDDTHLVCSMRANNELGTLQPTAEIAALCRARRVRMLSDTVQAMGKIPVDAPALGIDYAVLGGHKFHGPLGVAALWVRRGAPLEPLLVGAPQESGRRAGTENVPGIVGLGEAARLARLELPERHERLLELRRTFEEGLAAIPDAVVHCAGSQRLPHTSHVAFLGVSGHQLMLRLDELGYAVSTGSACHSGKPQPSDALLAMGIPEAEALASLRVSFGITNTATEVAGFLDVLASEVAALRAAGTASVG